MTDTHHVKHPARGSLSPEVAHLLMNVYQTTLLASIEALEYENPDIGAILGRALKQISELANYLGAPLEPLEPPLSSPLSLASETTLPLPPP
jgi:hypothetical protein